MEEDFEKVNSGGSGKKDEDKPQEEVSKQQNSSGSDNHLNQNIVDGKKDIDSEPKSFDKIIDEMNQKMAEAKETKEINPHVLWFVF